MGLRYKLRLYKGTDAATFRKEMVRAAEAMGGSIQWDVPGTNRYDDLRVAHDDDVHTIYLPYQEVDFIYCENLGIKLGLSWMEIRIQEGSIWDYCLCRGKDLLDTFSVCPQYWEAEETDPAELEKWQGKPEVLAEAWNLPVERIRNYLVNWGYRSIPRKNIFEFTRDGKAYPTDEHSYGDYEQFFDVLKVLGGREPMEQHTIHLPHKPSWLVGQ